LTREVHCNKNKTGTKWAKKPIPALDGGEKREQDDTLADVNVDSTRSFRFPFLLVVGRGYTVREYLGGGQWKSAYRASTPFRLADVALLFFHENVDYHAVAKDVSSLIKAAPGDPNAKYLAQFYSLNTTPPGRIFMVEELLARPLDRLSPLRDLTQFVRIARDLSRGLLFLHKHGLVHRDLKDNCGLDHQQQAKIFDLGSVTSEPGDVLGTIFTRAPELFVDGAKCDIVSDLWALGATLYALRTGDYPFIDKSDIEERKLINRAFRDNNISLEESKERKRALDSKARARVMREDAEKELQGRVHRTLRGRAKEILLSMLTFNRAQRAEIETIEREWSALAREFAGSIGPSVIRQSSKWDQIKNHLRAVSQHETRLTRKQLDKIISDYEKAMFADPGLGQDDELKQYLKEVKTMLLGTA
jgi:serine/threonine protein kinase